jgi:hypothetical protein
MELDPGHSARAKRTATPLVQASLALLVAGTLVTFSLLAFRTGFADQPQGTIEVAEPSRTDGRPVLLPSPGGTADGGSAGAGKETLVATTVDAVSEETDERVLGTRIGRVEETRGTGYDGAGDLDEDLSKRSGSSATNEDEGWDGTQKYAADKHGKSNSKAKGGRGLGHRKHGHHEHGHLKKGHAKHHH